MGGHCVGGILFQRTLGQPQRLIQNADFVVGKGVLAQKGPIVAAMGSRLLHQSKQGRRKVGHPGAAAASIYNRCASRSIKASRGHSARCSLVRLRA